MRVAIFAVGTRGDVQPCLALAQGLRAAGHEVCIAAEASFEPLVRRSGIGYSLVHGDLRGSFQSDSIRQLLGGKRAGPLARIFRGSMDRRVESGIALRVRDFYQASLDADVVVVSTLGLAAAYSVAEKIKRPLVRIFLAPPDLPLTRGFRQRPFLDRLTHRLFVNLVWTFFRGRMNRARRDVLGLPPLRAVNPEAELLAKGWPALCAYSAHVSPPPSDGDRAYQVTGYWFSNETVQWQPPRELEEFLAAGPPPVYVGFGSMVHRSPEATTDLVIEALARAGQRGILSTGWGGLQDRARSKHVYAIDEAPHDWLFSHVSAVVHHGGAGTTAAGLRAGRPTLVVPFGLPDQPYWGERVAALGVGPAAIDRRRLTVDALAQAITVAATDDTMRHRSAALGERIRAENGVARAVEVLERTYAGSEGRRSA